MSRQQEWQNGSFEEFIRQKADEGQPVEFDPTAWESMEKMLDRHMPAGKGVSSNGKGYSALIAALLITTLIGWYLFSNSYNQPDQLHKQQTAAEQTAANRADENTNTTETIQNNGNSDSDHDIMASQPEETGSQKKTAVNSTSPAIADISATGSGTSLTEAQAVQNTHDQKRAEGAADQGMGKAVEASDKSMNGTSAAADSSAKVTSSVGVASGTPRGEKSAENTAAAANSYSDAHAGKLAIVTALPEANKQLRQSSRPAGASGAGISEISDNATEGRPQLAERQQQQPFGFPSMDKRAWMPLELKAAVITAPPLPLPETPKAIKEVDAESVVKKQPSHSTFSISLTVAPDFTGTGQSGSIKPGAGAGFHLEYFFLPRLSVVSGAFYSKKNYLAGGGFSPYGEPWHYGHEPDYIDASCGVIDIPLNLRYYLLERSRHRFFISSGASSYLMRSEDYRMVYNDYYYEDYTYAVRNENKHLIAVWNLSLGYELALSQRWSLQAEPFLKIPVRGVGSGAAKLNSIGALVHLKYNFIRPGRE